jgi:hypothetical protein
LGSSSQETSKRVTTAAKRSTVRSTMSRDMGFWFFIEARIHKKARKKKSPGLI